MRAPPRSVLAEGDGFDVPVVAVGPDGKARAGIAVDVFVAGREFHQTGRLVTKGTWPSSEVDNRLVRTMEPACHLTSAEKPVTCHVTTAAAGSYEVVARAQDGATSVSTGFGFTVAGSGTVAWPRFDKERIDVVADKPATRSATPRGSWCRRRSSRRARC